MVGTCVGPLGAYVGAGEGSIVGLAEGTLVVGFAVGVGVGL